MVEQQNHPQENQGRERSQADRRKKTRVISRAYDVAAQHGNHSPLLGIDALADVRHQVRRGAERREVAKSVGDVAHSLVLGAAVAAFRQMALDSLRSRRRQLTVVEGRKHRVARMAQHTYTSSEIPKSPGSRLSRSDWRARANLDLTVPRGRSSVVEISS